MLAGTSTVCQMSAVCRECVWGSATLTPSVATTRYVREDCVCQGVAVTTLVLTLKPASTSSAEVTKLLPLQHEHISFLIHWLLLIYHSISILYWHIAFHYTDPCDGATTCGSCALCRVVNHGVQCSCPTGTIGNPQITCVKRPSRCDGNCACDEATGFCRVACKANRDCSCGEVCTSGVCSMKCSTNIACPQVKLYFNMCLFQFIKSPTPYFFYLTIIFKPNLH